MHPFLPLNTIERRIFSGSESLSLCYKDYIGRNFYCSWRVPKTKVEWFLLGPTYHYEHQQVESSPASSSTLCIQWLQSKEQHQCHGDTTTMANSTAETCRCQDIHDLQNQQWARRHTSKHLPAPHCPFYQRPLIEVYVAILPDRCYIYRFTITSLVFVYATSCRTPCHSPVFGDLQDGTSSPLLDAITFLSTFILHM